MLCNATDIENIGVCYSDLFGENQELQAKVTILLENKFKLRKQIEDTNTSDIRISCGHIPCIHVEKDSLPIYRSIMME